MHIIIFLLDLAALIIVHEFGHFIVAKTVGMTVEEFAVGFPPQLWSKKIGDTLYSLNLIFVGGFVRILGETPEEEGSEGTPQEPRAGSFSSKPRWAQGLVIIAGVAMNFLAAYILLTSAYLMGVPANVDDASRAQARDVHVEIMDVMPGAPADHAGLKTGDVIRSMQTGTATLAATSTADTVKDFIATHGDKSILVSITRKDGPHMLLVVPQTGVLAEAPTRKAIGVSFADIGTIQSPFPQALADGAHLFIRESAAVGQGLGGFFYQLFTGTLNMNEVSGPVGIAKAGGAAAADGAGALLMFAAMVSINLAFINLLPIPGLDGGRLILIIIESITHRPIPRRWSERLSIAGFSLLILLMLAVTYHDIFR